MSKRGFSWHWFVVIHDGMVHLACWSSNGKVDNTLCGARTTRINAQPITSGDQIDCMSCLVHRAQREA